MKTMVIGFEQLGGVGDGDLLTGAGTDNADAFDEAAKYGELGYRITFPSGKSFKTSRSIKVHDMDWSGSMTDPPTIFGWFDNSGNAIIGRNPSNKKIKATIRGIRFHRCGPHPEHGVLVDNMASFDFDGWVTAISAEDGHVKGGAIGVSPFQPSHRPSKNVNVKARISNSANFGVQFGNVSDANLQVFAENCMREVIGIEPYCLGFIDFNAGEISENTISAPHHGIETGQPIIYSPITAPDHIKGLPVSNYWFAIVVDENTLRIAESEENAVARIHVTLGNIPEGSHRMYICGVAERIKFLPSRINNINPPTQNVNRNLDGVVVLTATSGGYARDIDTGNVSISDFENRSAGYCVTLLGLWNIKISGFEARGGRIGGIRVGHGTLNGVRGSNGESIAPPKNTKVVPRGILVQDNKVMDFPTYGIHVLDGEASVTGNLVSTRARGAKGISTPGIDLNRASIDGSRNNVAVPLGVPYSRVAPGERD